jgi:hypothetical protein
MRGIYEFRARYRDVDPVIFLGPSIQISHNLRLAATFLSPKQTSSVKSLEHASPQSHSPHIVRSPVVIAFLVVAAEI